MSSTVALRATLALVLLIGFHLLAVACVVGVAAVTVYLAVVLGSGPNEVVFAAGFGIVVAIAIGVFRSLSIKAPHPAGRRLLRSDAPRLWNLVDDVADRVETAPPDELWLVTDANAGVFERTKLLGLIGGRRYLLLGMPLMATMSTTHLRGVLAHELGHYATHHTRLAALGFRGHLAVNQVLDQLERRRFDPVAVIFRLYAVLYVAVQSAVSRQQEYEADRAAAHIIGRTPMRDTLRELDDVIPAWRAFIGGILATRPDEGCAPPGIYEDFIEYLDRRRPVESEPDPSKTGHAAQFWRTHPLTVDRIAALESAPEVPRARPDEPGSRLVPDFTRIAASMADELFGSGRRGTDTEYHGRSVRTANKGGAAVAWRAVRLVTGAEPLNLAALLAAVESGDGPVLSHKLTVAGFPNDGYRLLVLSAAFADEATRTEWTWDGDDHVELPDGTRLDVGRLAAALAQVDAVVVPKVRELFARSGVDLDRDMGFATRSEDSDLRPDPEHDAAVDVGTARVTGALANVKLDGEPNDLVVTDKGLLFISCPHTARDGAERLRSLLAQADGAAALSRLPGALWLPYADFASVRVRRANPLRAVITMCDGANCEFVRAWTGDEIAGSSPALLARLRRIAENRD